MVKIRHRFLTHKVNPATETLILGTFNPDTPGNEADFFYGRRRNQLWTLLPRALGEDSLQKADKVRKKEFLDKHRIDFVDLIAEVEVEPGKEDVYSDTYIDGKVTRWRDVIAVIYKLPELKKIGLTRKTTAGIPRMKKKIAELEKYCENQKIIFLKLTTPAGYPGIDRAARQAEWTDFFMNND